MGVLSAAWSHLRHLAAEPEAALYAMKQLVHEQSPAQRPILGDHLPDVRDPRRVTPLNRRVHEAEHAGTVTSRRRLARCDRSSGGVRNHHRPAQRDAPETAAVPLAERLGFLEILLCELLIDLSYRRRRVAYNHVRQDCRAKRRYPH